MLFFGGWSNPRGWGCPGLPMRSIVYSINIDSNTAFETPVTTIFLYSEGGLGTSSVKYWVGGRNDYDLELFTSVESGNELRYSDSKNHSHVW